jgi:hypothetical protein
MKRRGSWFGLGKTGAARQDRTVDLSVANGVLKTIPGDQPDAEALSGLARLFFYAGARALLLG